MTVGLLHCGTTQVLFLQYTQFITLLCQMNLINRDGATKAFFKNVYNKLIMVKRYYQDNCEYPRKNALKKLSSSQTHSPVWDS